jgi:hypothetical protein
MSGATLAKKEGAPRQTWIASVATDDRDARCLENLGEYRRLYVELTVERAGAARGFFVLGLQLAFFS